MARSHHITITVAGTELPFWTDYQIELDLQTPADAFTVSTVAPDALDPGDRALYAALRKGADITIAIDHHPVITGTVTGRSFRDDRLTIRGHDRIWRLFESAPMRRIATLTLADLAAELSAGIFPRVTFSNARNRALYARAGDRRQAQEPPIFDKPDDPRKIPIGATKWSALAEVLRRADLLAWSSGDGRELILGRPQFTQEPAFTLTHARDTAQSTCTAVAWDESIEERYSSITVLGTARVPRGSSGYGANLSRQAAALDTTGDFPFPRRLRLVEDCRSIDEAQRLAEAALAERNATALTIEVDAWQHGQAGRLYAPDTVADVVQERSGLRGSFYIVSARYTGSRTQASTSLTLVPLGTKLVIR